MRPKMALPCVPWHLRITIDHVFRDGQSIDVPLKDYLKPWQLGLVMTSEQFHQIGAFNVSCCRSGIFVLRSRPN